MPDKEPKGKAEGELSLIWTIVIGIIGVTIIGVAIRTGKKWDFSDLVYDLGKTLITVAIVDLLVLRAFRRLAARKDDIERLIEESESLASDVRQTHEENMKWLQEFRVEQIHNSTSRVKDQCDTILERLEEIRINVDPVYAALAKFDEEQTSQ